MAATVTTSARSTPRPAPRAAASAAFGVVEHRLHASARYRRGPVPHAFVALLLIHLHFSDSESLKEKRKEFSSVKAQLRTRLGVAVSEVDGQDTWQRSTLAGALTSGSFKHETHGWFG